MREFALGDDDFTRTGSRGDRTNNGAEAGARQELD